MTSFSVRAILAFRLMNSPKESTALAKEVPFKLVLIASLLIGAFVVFADYYAVSPKGSVEILMLRDFVALPACAAVPGILIAAIYCVRRSTRQKASKWFLICSVFVVVTIASMKIGHRIRMDAFRSLAERSEPLVAAIKAYEQAHGKPPFSLGALVPEFLPAIPNTDMGAYPEYRYIVPEDHLHDGNPWVIIVSASTGILDFDRFFYYPLQNYPSHLWETNPVQRVGDWGYVHE